MKKSRPSAHSVIETGNIVDIRKAITKKTASAKNDQNQSLLHAACLAREAHLEVVKLLIQKYKLDVNAADNAGWTPLHCVCQVSCNFEIITALLEFEANPKMNNNDGNTPLHYFVRFNPTPRELKKMEECLDLLLERGAFMNARNHHGETPLHQAILRGSVQVFVMLVNRGGNFKLTNKYGETLLHYAVMAQKKRIVEMLLDLGMDPNGGNGVHGSELDVARSIGPQGKEIYDLLLSKAKQPDLQTVGSLETSTASPQTLGSRGSGGADAGGADKAADKGDRTGEEIKLKLLRKTHHWQIDFNELVVQDRVGKGAFGAVYKARWRGTTVAMKKIHSAAMNKKEMDTFFKEIHTMSRLRHPNIVLFLGACLEDPNICLITEFMKKGDLHTVLRKETDLSWALKLRMAMDGARGMLYLHLCSPPVVHRDLKSLNMLVDDHYNIKVTDFGISKATGGGLETTNSKLGTLNWLAPEILENKPYSPAADVYSYGIILWEILTQQTPFQGLNNMKILNQVLSGQGPEIPASADPNYAQLMRDCWSRDPKARPSMDQVLETLERIYTGLSPAAVATGLATSAGGAFASFAPSPQAAHGSNSLNNTNVNSSGGSAGSAVNSSHSGVNSGGSSAGLVGSNNGNTGGRKEEVTKGVKVSGGMMSEATSAALKKEAAKSSPSSESSSDSSDSSNSSDSSDAEEEAPQKQRSEGAKLSKKKTTAELRKERKEKLKN